MLTMPISYYIQTVLAFHMMICCCSVQPLVTPSACHEALTVTDVVISPQKPNAAFKRSIHKTPLARHASLAPSTSRQTQVVTLCLLQFNSSGMFCRHAHQAPSDVGKHCSSMLPASQAAVHSVETPAAAAAAATTSPCHLLAASLCPLPPFLTAPAAAPPPRCLLPRHLLQQLLLPHCRLADLT